MPIYGVGKQWMWKFQHPEGQREINMLHVPVGRPVKLLLTSEDVIHSFFVPGVSRPHGRACPTAIRRSGSRPTRPGNYHLFCSQYCGTDHAGMIGTVVVMEPADYQDWLARARRGSLALEGRKVCSANIAASAAISADANARAPVLEGLYGTAVHLRDGRTVVADETIIRESILHPGAKIVAGWQNIMPTFQGQIGEEEIDALIAYYPFAEARRNAAARRELSAAGRRRRDRTHDRGVSQDEHRHAIETWYPTAEPSRRAARRTISTSRTASSRGC